jgi:hypothetical protein
VHGAIHGDVAYLTCVDGTWTAGAEASVDDITCSACVAVARDAAKVKREHGMAELYFLEQRQARYHYGFAYHQKLRGGESCKKAAERLGTFSSVQECAAKAKVEGRRISSMAPRRE